MTIRALKDLFRRRDHRSEINAEIEAHLRMAIQDRIERGSSPEEARSSALREFGNVGLVQETIRSVWGWPAVEQFFLDIRSGIRILWKAPGLSITAIVLISLVIGGNTTIYCVLHAFLAKPAPGVHADRLVSIGYTGNYSEQPSSYSSYLGFSQNIETLGHLFASGSDRLTLGLKNGSYAVFGAYVTPNYFEALDVRNVIGHTLADSDNPQQDSSLTVIISHRLWQEHFQGSADVIGSSILLNERIATVVGIAPPLFQGVSLGLPEDVWFPIVPYFRQIVSEDGMKAVGTKGVAIFGQLKPEISMPQARSELQGILSGLQAADPSLDKKLAIRLTPYSSTIFGIADAGNQPLAVFSIVTAITLLIVCANVSNLMLGRSIARRREIAVRQSLGASRTRILRMLIAEGVAISILAGVASCIVAFWTTKAIPLFLPSGPNVNGMVLNHANMDFSPDWTVLGYAMILALIGAISFTVVPAWQTLRRDVLPDLKAGEQSIALGRSRIAGVMVVTQFALTAVLLTSVGLVYRASSSLDAFSPGFDKHNLLLLTINPTLNIHGRDAQLERVEAGLTRLRQINGVISASFTRMPPPRPSGAKLVTTASAPQQPIPALAHYVGSDYLKTLGLNLAAGREFLDSDRSMTQRSVIVNQSLADALWPGQSAIGQLLRLSGLGTGNKKDELVEVIGVAPNILDSAAASQSSLTRYDVLFAEEQDPAPRTAQLGIAGSGEITFLIRYTASLDTVVSSASAVLRQVDSRIPIVYTRTMETQLSALGKPYRAVLALLTMFAGIGITIAVVGQYAVMTFMMKRRTNEFGVRIALGASQRQILTSILKEGFFLTFAGIVFGFALSAAAGTLLKSLLYGVSPTDARTYLGVLGLLSAVSLIACYLPARRASRVDPIVALRYE